MNEFNLYKTITEIEWISVFGAIILLIAFCVALIILIEKFTNYIGKPIKWFKRNDDDHDLLLKTMAELELLKNQQSSDKEKMTEFNEDLKKTLDDFVLEVRDCIVEIRATQTKTASDIDKIIERNKLRDEATIEEMCDRIEQKSSNYIKMGGIPEDELDTYSRLFHAYEKLGGNHGAKLKFEFCTKNLPLILNSQYKSNN